ncbi:hypothetical protein Tco_0987792, partial [Tanacetum coccineum]
MLEKGNYIPWESRFIRFLDNKFEDEERMWRLIIKGPYERPMITDPDDTHVDILKPLSKMTESNKKQYIADVKVMNYLLQAIPNDIYNLVDTCKMLRKCGTELKAKEEESLVSVYERLTTLVNITLVNIMDRNNVHPIPVSINPSGANIEHMLLAMKDETERNLNDEENDFMLDNSFGDETLEELTAIVNASHKMIPIGVQKHKNHWKRKTVINTSDDDQINSNIIFDDPYVENNGGSDEHDSTAHDQYYDVKILAYNALREAENRQRLNNELKKYKELLQKDLETCKERVKTFESKTIQCLKYKETCDELEREIRADKDAIKRILKEKDKTESDFFKIENENIIIQHETQLAKKAFKERENRYLKDIVDLEEKLSSHDRIVYKMGQSIQTIHMLGKTPNKVYDLFLKA